MIDRLVRVLAAVFPERDAEHLADALWLAATCGEPDIGSSIPGERREDGSAFTEVDVPAPAGQVQVSGALAELALPSGEPLPPAQPASRVTEIGLHVPTTTPTLAAMTALSLFRRVHRPGRPIVDIDATVEATADAERLVVITRPDQEPGLDVAIVVDQTPVAMVWTEAIVELEGTLRRTGAFRSVTCWSLDRSTTTSLVGGPLVRDRAGATHHSDHIIDPAGRRLVLLFSDGVANDWGEGGMWQLLRRWAQAMPTALVQLLPESYWGYTTIGQPTVMMRSRRLAGPNSSFEVRTAWWSDADDARAGVPVPVIGLNPDAIVRWTHAVGTGSTWIEAGWANLPPTQTGQVAHSRPSAAERVQAFQTRASVGAQRLARVLAGAPLLSLPLIRVLHEHLVPQPMTEHLAELLVGGLLERLPGDARRGNLLLRFRPGVGELLYEGTTTSQEWDVFELLTHYLERNAGSGATVRAVLADPDGTTTVEGGLVPFAAMGRGMALRLGLEVGETAGSPASSEDEVQPDRSGVLAASPPIGPSRKPNSSQAPAEGGVPESRPGMTVIRRYFKRMKNSDAQQPPGANSRATGNLRLSEEDFPINNETYFVEEFFGGLDWRPNARKPNAMEEVWVPMQTVIDGDYLGAVNLRISHQPSRVSNQGNVPTVLHWGDLGARMRANNYVDQYVTLERGEEDNFALTISREPPGDFRP